MLPSVAGYCWTHVDDIVQGHILAMEKGRIGESYNLCGEPMALADGFKLACQIANKRVPLIVPYQVMGAMSVLVKPFESLLPEIYSSEGLRVLAGVTYWGDNSKAKRELGFNPRPIREGWTETVKYEMQLLGMS
jgi:nucleoside-diphosphate-sugar epimerase